MQLYDDIRLRAGEPLREGRVRPIENLVPFSKPVDLAFGQLTPKRLRVLLWRCS